jgi:alkylhydroperoxidase/carboxymuconolactone decarboxylase family protein YurZ
MLTRPIVLFIIVEPPPSVGAFADRQRRVEANRGASKTTHLDAKTRKLIAIAIAVTTRKSGEALQSGAAA